MGKKGQDYKKWYEAPIYSDNSTEGYINNIQKPKLKRRNKGIQCRECEWYGHIQAEYSNTLSKQCNTPIWILCIV